LTHRKDYEEGRISYDEYLMLEKLSRSDPAKYRRRERAFRTRGSGPGRVVYPVADEKMDIDEVLAEPDPEPRVQAACASCGRPTSTAVNGIPCCAECYDSL
jgi:hypothetical protein